MSTPAQAHTRPVRPRRNSAAKTTNARDALAESGSLSAPPRRRASRAMTPLLSDARIVRALDGMEWEVVK